jgi:plasmid stabilization system protein ParE
MAGSALREKTDGPYRKLIYRRWNIIYAVRQEKVYIMRVWPAALGPVDFDLSL